jgi:hypothetical protein
MEVVRIIMAISILVVAVVVALQPRVVYAPQPRVVLYFLMSVLVATLLGAEATAQLQLKLPGFCLVSSGAAAVCFGMLWLLNHLSKPEEKIAVFSVEDEHGMPVNLELDQALDVALTPTGLQVTKFVTGDTVILIFPEQVGEAELRVRKTANGPRYTGMVSYAGSRSTKLRLGRDLRLPS